MKLEEEKTNYNDVIEKLQNAEDKSAAIVETINEIVEQKYSKIIDETIKLCDKILSMDCENFAIKELKEKLLVSPQDLNSSDKTKTDAGEQ